MKDTARYIRSKVKRQTDRQGGKTDRSCESGGGGMSKETQKVTEATKQESRYGQSATWSETVKGK